MNPHPFDPGYSGMSTACNELVIRDGDTDECGLPADDPIHAEERPAGGPTRRELAWYVLRQFGDERWPKPGSFYESLVDTIARADPQNQARLALAYDELVGYVQMAQRDDDGMDRLSIIASRNR